MPADVKGVGNLEDVDVGTVDGIDVEKISEEKTVTGIVEVGDMDSLEDDGHALLTLDAEAAGTLEIGKLADTAVVGVNLGTSVDGEI